MYNLEFDSWSDGGDLDDLSRLVDYVAKARECQITAFNRELEKVLDLAKTYPNGPPVCVLGSPGVGNTTVFCVVDMCINRLKSTSKRQEISIYENARNILMQSYGCFSNVRQYIMCYKAVCEYANRSRLIKKTFDALI